MGFNVGDAITEAQSRAASLEQAIQDRDKKNTERTQTELAAQLERLKFEQGLPPQISPVYDSKGIPRSLQFDPNNPRARAAQIEQDIAVNQAREQALFASLLQRDEKRDGAIIATDAEIAQTQEDMAKAVTPTDAQLLQRKLDGLLRLQKSLKFSIPPVVPRVGQQPASAVLPSFPGELRPPTNPPLAPGVEALPVQPAPEPVRPERPQVAPPISPVGPPRRAQAQAPREETLGAQVAGNRMREAIDFVKSQEGLAMSPDERAAIIEEAGKAAGLDAGAIDELKNRHVRGYERAQQAGQLRATAVENLGPTLHEQIKQAGSKLGARDVGIALEANEKGQQSVNAEEFNVSDAKSLQALQQGLRNMPDELTPAQRLDALGFVAKDQLRGKFADLERENRAVLEDGVLTFKLTQDGERLTLNRKGLRSDPTLDDPTQWAKMYGLLRKMLLPQEELRFIELDVTELSDDEDRGPTNYVLRVKPKVK